MTVPGIKALRPPVYVIMLRHQSGEGYERARELLTPGSVVYMKYSKIAVERGVIDILNEKRIGYDIVEKI
ncbi:MAG: hypothetical protein HY518_05975 [Candidatus Aenigmarchaeota archaeon]|nr:hypothetical protein [Candidatus Aenigmarchaeota archaeon]